MVLFGFFGFTDSRVIVCGLIVLGFSGLLGTFLFFFLTGLFRPTLSGLLGTFFFLTGLFRPTFSGLLGTFFFFFVTKDS